MDLESQELVFQVYTPTNALTPKEFYKEKLDEVYKEVAKMPHSNLSKEEKKRLDNFNHLIAKYQILINP